MLNKKDSLGCLFLWRKFSVYEKLATKHRYKIILRTWSSVQVYSNLIAFALTHCYLLISYFSFAFYAVGLSAVVAWSAAAHAGSSDQRVESINRYQ